MKGESVLHVGCGTDSLPSWIQGKTETRLDIDAAVNPDIAASMLELGDIGEYDIVFCRHALEHVYPHEVNVALTEFRRVLKTNGYVMVFVPDLEGVRPTDEVILESPSGPITGLDMIYGYGKALKDNPYMAHKTGFVMETLEAAIHKAGFSMSKVTRIGDYNLMGVGVK